MGYTVGTMGGCFQMSRGALDEASAALLKAERTPRWAKEDIEGWKGGGGHPLVSALCDLGFEPHCSPEGAIEDMSYDSKWSDDEFVILRIIAPYVVPGSFLEFEGEELHDWWRWDFDGKGISERTGYIAWSEPQEC